MVLADLRGVLGASPSTPADQYFLDLMQLFFINFWKRCLLAPTPVSYWWSVRPRPRRAQTRESARQLWSKHILFGEYILVAVLSY